MLLPVNQEKRKSLNERDGPSRTDGNFGDAPNYYPNSRIAHDRIDLYEIVESPFGFNMDDVYAAPLDSVHQQYLHARQTYYAFSQSERDVLHKNLAYALSSVTRMAILDRVLGHLHNISSEYAARVQSELDKFNKFNVATF